MRIMLRAPPNGDLDQADTITPDAGPASADTDDPPSHIEDIKDDATLATGTPRPLRLAGGSASNVSPSRPWDVSRLPLVDRDHYEVAGELAHGGIGRVLRAWDSRLDRTVALKELLDPVGEAAERFVREALVTARLQHPSIVPIYEAGRWPNGQLFYAMRMVSGRPFDALIAERKTLQPRLALLPHVLAAAEAVAYAHSKRIIHRDLKPANILVGAFGETVVIDWGLAKDLNDGAGAELPESAPGFRSPPLLDLDPSSTSLNGPAAPVEPLTMIGAVLGTPKYMPPEQAAGLSVDERADVYALGAILYHVLCGTAPYRGAHQYAVVRKVLDGPPRPLEQRQPGIPEDLLTLVRKAMARDPAERYPTARELAEDLRRFQTGQIIGAHQYSRRERALRFIRRQRVALAVAASALALMVLSGALSVQRILAERDRADTRADELTLEQARAAASRDPTQALAWLKSLSPAFPRGATVRTIAADARAHGISTVLRGHAAPLNNVVFSPDGATVATSSDDHTIRIWDIKSGAHRVLRGHTDEAWQLAFSPDGKLLASSGKDKTVQIWNVATGAARALAAGAGALNALKFSPDGKLLAAASTDKTILLWNLERGERRVFTGHTGKLWRLTFSPDGKRLASTANDMTVRVWDVATGEAQSFAGHEADTTGVAFSPDSRFVASASKDMTARVWDLTNGQVRVLSGASGPLSVVAFSPDGRTLATAGFDRMVRLWDLTTGTARLLSGHEGWIRQIAFSPDGTQLASASGDCTVRLWDMETGEARVLYGFTDVVFDLSFSPDGQTLAAASWDRTARLFPTKAGERRRLTGHEAAVHDAVFSPDGAQLASASQDGTVRLWELHGAGSIGLQGHDGPVSKVIFSPDGAWLASAGQDGTVRLWDRGGNAARIVELYESAVTTIAFSPDSRWIASTAVDGMVHLTNVKSAEDRVLTGHTSEVTSLAFSPDSKRIASAGKDETVWLWDIDADRGQVFRGHDREVLSLAFSPGGELLASGEGDHTLRLWDPTRPGGRRIETNDYGASQIAFTPDGKSIITLSRQWNSGTRLWDVATGESLGDLAGHGDTVNRFALSPDGSRIATGSIDRTVRIWDLASHESRILRGHQDEILAVAFSPDGKWIASASKDRTVRLWSDDLPTDPRALRDWIDTATPETIDRSNPSLKRR
jgi:eukaryotic-like serine/threonine-protein kinase